jgi:Thymidylate synthase complementing protein.
MEVKLLEYGKEMDWNEVYRRALVTCNKELKSEPTPEWKYRILKARHSPIRYLRYSFLLKDIPYWVANELRTHKHSEVFMMSQRNDRQANYDRNTAPQNAPVTMIWDMNAEELMTIANKRLCKKATQEARDIVRAMCDLVMKRNRTTRHYLYQCVCTLANVEK